ncbi:MAG: hypothetical protein IIA85_02355 [Nanoarchaeota archaeon]|nr:hypothetical protein [Nanoarchaeota archaeon]
MKEIHFSEESGESFEEYLSRIKEEVRVLEEEGFEYLQDWQGQPYIPDRVKLPDGSTLDESELEKELEENPQYILLQKASRLVDLYFAEGFESERFEQISFLSREDEIRTEQKYSK